MIWRLSLLCAVFAVSRRLGRHPDHRRHRSRRTRGSRRENRARSRRSTRSATSNNQSVTCSMYRPGRKDDPVAAANANPAIAGLVRRIAREEGVDENQFLALVYQESRFNPCAKSGAGAIGLAQLMPGTAGDLGVDPYNIEQNLRGGARYYKQQLRSATTAMSRWRSPPTMPVPAT